MENSRHKDLTKSSPTQKEGVVLREALRRAGLRATLARLAVLKVLMDTRSPVSHAELVTALEGCEFDRATLYRNLMDLTEAGLLERIDLGDHIWRFELRVLEGEKPQGRRREKVQERKGNSHPHFACTDCGQVSCLPEVTFKARAAFKVPKALSEQRVSVQIRGQCDDCSQ
ncbi:MAG: transcriptional repressor [Cystobacterineae bacterium]|nr:transcriptional repressor [Cystobacterineae bacterium]